MNRLVPTGSLAAHAAELRARSNPDALTPSDAFCRLKSGDVFWVNFFEYRNRLGGEPIREAALCRDEKEARETAEERGYLFTQASKIDGTTQYLDLSPMSGE